jgi:hypothetical protein
MGMRRTRLPQAAKIAFASAAPGMRNGRWAHAGGSFLSGAH